MNMGRFILLAVMIWFTSCEVHDGPNHHTTIKVTNLSDKPIYVKGEWAWAPDYTGNNSPQYSRIGPDDSVDCGATNTEALRQRPRDSYEETMSPPLKAKLWLFFIDAEMLDNLPHTAPIPDGLVLKQKLYALEDLQSLNFHVTYP